MHHPQHHSRAPPNVIPAKAGISRTTSEFPSRNTPAPPPSLRGGPADAAISSTRSTDLSFFYPQMNTDNRYRHPLAPQGRKNCSPGRKPWVTHQPDHQPRRGGRDIGYPNNSFALTGLHHFKHETQGLRPGLHSLVPPGLPTTSQADTPRKPETPP